MGFSLKWRSAKSPMFPLEPVPLEALSGSFRGNICTISEPHPPVDTESLRGDTRKIRGRFYPLFLTADQDLNFSLGWEFELEQRAHPVLPLSVTISHLEQINQGEPSHVNSTDHFGAWVYLKEGWICSTGWQVNFAVDEEDFQPSKLL